MQTIRSRNRGFSLVELIVVMAVMVFLTVVLVPMYTRYIDRSNAAVVAVSAQNVYDVVKVEFISGNLTMDKDDTVGTVTVSVPGGTGNVKAELSENLHYENKQSPGETFNVVCGISADRKLNTDTSYTITIDNSSSTPRFSMAESEEDSE